MRSTSSPMSDAKLMGGRRTRKTHRKGCRKAHRKATRKADRKTRKH